MPNKFNYTEFLEKINYEKFNNLDIKFTIAVNGEGVLDSFEEIIRLIFKELYKSELIETIH